MRPIDYLVRDLKWTKGPRFNAEKRLERADRDAVLITTFSSAFLIVFTVLPKFLPLPSPVVSLVEGLGVTLSILLLAVSVIQSRNEYGVKARQMRWCALELNELHKEARQIASLEEPAEDKLKTLMDRRAHILAKYDVNHDEIDFERYKIEHAGEFDDLRGLRVFTLRLYVFMHDVVRAAVPWVVILAYSGAFAWLVWSYGVMSALHQNPASTP